MRFWEAMKALEEGKKVWCPSVIGMVKWHLSNDTKEMIIIAENGRAGIDFSYYLYQALNKEWELYEEPQKTYSFMQMLPFLKDGKRFKRKHWDKEGVFLGTCIYSPCTPVVFIDNTQCRLNIEDYEAQDWIEVV